MKVSSAEFIKGIRGSDRVALDGRAQVAFVGRSNAGKSSLINALAGNKSLVKVSNRPGKTTEINFFLVNNRFYFVDLPGYGYAKVGPVEKEKLQKLIVWYLTAPEISPALVVLAIDVKVGLTEFDQQMLEILRAQGHPFVIAANKADKLSQANLAKQLAGIIHDAMGAEVVVCSAVSKGGTHELLKRVGHATV